MTGASPEGADADSSAESAASRRSRDRVRFVSRARVCAAGEAWASAPGHDACSQHESKGRHEKTSEPNAGFASNFIAGGTTAISAAREVTRKEITQDQNRAAAFRRSFAAFFSPSSNLRARTSSFLFSASQDSRTYPRGAGLAPPESAPHPRYPHRAQPWAAACATKLQLTVRQRQASSGSTGRQLQWRDFLAMAPLYAFRASLHAVSKARGKRKKGRRRRPEKTARIGLPRYPLLKPEQDGVRAAERASARLQEAVASAARAQPV